MSEAGGGQFPRGGLIAHLENRVELPALEIFRPLPPVPGSVACLACPAGRSGTGCLVLSPQAGVYWFSVGDGSLWTQGGPAPGEMPGQAARR